MKNKEFKVLNQLVDHTAAAQNTPSLDQEILEAAELQAVRNKKSSKISFEVSQAFSQIGSAFGSAVVTAVVFFILALQLSVSKDSLDITNSVSPSVTFEWKPKASDSEQILKPDSPARMLAKAPFDRSSADQILKELRLPTAPSLVREMQFTFESDRIQSAELIEQALADINRHIDNGSLSAARNRYIALLEQCHACQLPSTLEGLALSNISSFDSG